MNTVEPDGSSSQCQHGFVDAAETPSPPPRAAGQPYHHGALREALIDAGKELAREGGPDAIVLREVARRIGVSPNAAYRHFTDLSELVMAVADASLTDLAHAMEEEVRQAPLTGDPRADAVAQLLACGKGYVHFALRQPGLFAVAFSPAKESINPDATSGEGAVLASGRLLHALDRLVEVGLLPPEDHPAAAITAWAAVHGLANLLLGPLGAVHEADREPMIDASLQLVCRSITGGACPA